ncbi:hypothetical protein EAS54_05780 [Bradyrhizobium guangzhouense]|nr:hypothetical protein EAS54_05780 [Bradyrhizobium guangzhouense]
MEYAARDKPVRKCPKRGGSSLPLPLVGEGRGEGVTSMGQPPRGENPHPRLRHSRGSASASPKNGR